MSEQTDPLKAVAHTHAGMQRWLKVQEPAFAKIARSLSSSPFMNGHSRAQ
jgi:hypothetical protein